MHLNVNSRTYRYKKKYKNVDKGVDLSDWEEFCKRYRNKSTISPQDLDDWLEYSAWKKRNSKNKRKKRTTKNKKRSYGTLHL